MRARPIRHGISVRPSGLFQSLLLRPVGFSSLVYRREPDFCISKEEFFLKKILSKTYHFVPLAWETLGPINNNGHLLGVGALSILFDRRHERNQPSLSAR